MFHFLTKACSISNFSGLGNSEYITIPESVAYIVQLRYAFRRSGFAMTGKTGYVLGPCPRGSFLNSSVTDPAELKCIACPVGELREFFHIICLSLSQLPELRIWRKPNVNIGIIIIIILITAYNDKLRKHLSRIISGH